MNGALAELERGAGTHFDPQIVAALEEELVALEDRASTGSTAALTGGCTY